MSVGYLAYPTCTQTGKRKFPSRREAFAAYRANGKAYRCKSCGAWHISRGYR